MVDFWPKLPRKSNSLVLFPSNRRFELPPSRFETSTTRFSAVLSKSFRPHSLNRVTII